MLLARPIASSSSRVYAGPKTAGAVRTAVARLAMLEGVGEERQARTCAQGKGEIGETLGLARTVYIHLFGGALASVSTGACWCFLFQCTFTFAFAFAHRIQP